MRPAVTNGSGAERGRTQSRESAVALGDPVRAGWDFKEGTELDCPFSGEATALSLEICRTNLGSLKGREFFSDNPH
jgi:hypothetical protein